MKLPRQVNLVFELLETAGFEVYLVGGAVRDYVRSKGAFNDWDITTNALPEQVKAVFHDYHLIETGLKHGTITVMIDKEPIEITTYRIDGDYSDNRHPDSVSFTRSLKEDLERRDFTMNALAYNPKTGIVDFVGGSEDIAAGVIRCVGDPDKRFREDALRMLRALRLASVFDMNIEEKTAEAIHRNKQLLSGIAQERIRIELTKMLCGVGAKTVLLEFADVLAIPLPEIQSMFGFEQHNPHHDKNVWDHTVEVVSAIRPEAVLRWTALLHDIGKPGCFSVGEDGIGHFYGHAERSTELAGEILMRLRFDHVQKERILRLVRYHDLPIAAERKVVKRLMNKHGVEAVEQLIEMHKADTLGQSEMCINRIEEYNFVGTIVNELVEEEACFSLKDLEINGNDLLMLGFVGKSIGQNLQACLNAVMDERVENEKGTLIDFVVKQNNKG